MGQAILLLFVVMAQDASPSANPILSSPIPSLLPSPPAASASATPVPSVIASPPATASAAPKATPRASTAPGASQAPAATTTTPAPATPTPTPAPSPVVNPSPQTASVAGVLRVPRQFVENLISGNIYQNGRLNPPVTITLLAGSAALILTGFYLVRV